MWSSFYVVIEGVCFKVPVELTTYMSRLVKVRLSFYPQNQAAPPWPDHVYFATEVPENMLFITAHTIYIKYEDCKYGLVWRATIQSSNNKKQISPTIANWGRVIGVW